ncbi:MAG: hypothetical protein AAF572_24935 [Cyanobacteria bacterium P01_B01_bin.77]
MNPLVFDRFKVLKKYQYLNNYQIEDRIDDSTIDNLCVIYCSSHGIYPDRKSAFYKAIVQEDRYEWKRNMIKTAKKSIFVRDLKKQWYLEGINQSVNSLSKLLDFLKKETTGMRLICIGNSAGGYLATLLGCELRASHVFSFSGQFSLYHYLNKEKSRVMNPILLKYEETQIAKSFYSLTAIIESSQVPIFYFYPLGSQSDINQVLTIEGVTNIYKIPFNLSEHGKTCWPINFSPLFKVDVFELKKLSEKFRDGVDPFCFSLHVSGYRKTLIFLTIQTLKMFWHSCRAKIKYL